MKKLIMFLATTIASFSFTATANPYQAIGDYVETNKETIRLNSGTAVAVVKDNQVVYEGYFGYADIANKTPVDANTVFYIASMTKPFYALLALLQEHKQQLDTNWTLAKLLPGIEFKPALHAHKVTIRDLLSHTSGIDNWPLVQATAWTGLYDKATIESMLAASYVNENAPFGQFDYTNVGYNILSHWMDNHFDSDWQGLLETEIFKPLGMQSTSARMSDIGKNNWVYAQGYSVKSPEPETPVYLTKNDASMHAAGGMVSTAKDLARFLIAQTNNGKLNERQALPATVIEKSHETLASHTLFGREQHYGWGWFIRELFGHRMLEHRGGYAGASTYMSFMPEQNIGLVVLSNQDRWGGDLAYALEDIAYGIALGKADQEIAKFIAENQNRATEKAQQHYAADSSKPPVLARGLGEQYMGTFSHELLGEIKVSKNDVSGYQLSWGNLRSGLFQGNSGHELQVEFIPNSPQPILFLSGTDKSHRLQYQDYIFSRTQN